MYRFFTETKATSTAIKEKRERQKERKGETTKKQRKLKKKEKKARKRNYGEMENFPKQQYKIIGIFYRICFMKLITHSQSFHEKFD